VLSPNAAQGRLQVNDVFNATYRYRLREALVASAFVRTEQYSDRDGVPAALQASFGTTAAGASLEGELGRSLSWRVSCAQVVRDGPGSPRSNSVSAGLSWRGLSRSNSF
jgi:hypothetical protein